MIIYGCKGTKIGHAILPDPCPHCGKLNQMETYVFQMYAHIFWIPVFPVFKTGASQCNNCHQIVKPKAMPAGLKSSYQNLKSSARMPLWTFTGLALIAVLVFFIIRSNDQDEKDTIAFLRAPKPGDIMEVKSQNAFTLYKVGLIEGDSVFIYPNMYETDRETGLYQIKEKGDSVFEKDLYGFSKAELQQMLKKGEILNVER